MDDLHKVEIVSDIDSFICCFLMVKLYHISCLKITFVWHKSIMYTIDQI